MVDRFYSAERAIAPRDEKRHLGESADAVEMESFQVLFKARTDGIPAVAIRSISDAVDEDLPLDMNEVFTERGEVSIPRVLGQVALRPAIAAGTCPAWPEKQAGGGIARRVSGPLYSGILAKGEGPGIRYCRGRFAANRTLSRDMSQTIAHIGSHEASKPNGKMRAGVYRGKGRVVVESVPIPEIGEGEVLFRVGACGICGTDIKKIHHGFLAPPQILGHELAGTVVQVGAGVKKFKPGDRVVSFHHIPCGDCFYCEQKLFSQCAGYKKVGLTAGFDPNGGGFAEYVRAMPWIVERGMLRLPDDVSFEEATFVEPVNTCLKAVRKARVAAGETVLVIGQGPIGMLLMLLAKLRRSDCLHERSNGRTPRGERALRREGILRSRGSESCRRNARAHRWPGRGRRAGGRAQPVISAGSPFYRAAGRKGATVCA